jgi:hypothetical protein
MAYGETAYPEAFSHKGKIDRWLFFFIIFQIPDLEYFKIKYTKYIYLFIYIKYKRHAWSYPVMVVSLLTFSFDCEHIILFKYLCIFYSRIEIVIDSWNIDYCHINFTTYQIQIRLKAFWNFDNTWQYF